MKPPAVPPPHAFRPAPGQNVPSLHPQVAPARVVQVVAVPRTVPTLTVYADGFVNPNGEAADLLASLAEGVCLHAPAPVRAGRTPNLWELSAGECCLLYARGDKPGHRRFRADPHLCPPPGRYVLTPVAHQPQRFRLIPF